MDYKEMITEARAKGLATEGKMWAAIDLMGASLEELKDAHPEMYWKLMRKNHRIMFNGHYTEEFAEHDVSKLHYTDAQGKEHKGGHWTKEEVAVATTDKVFPHGVTDCDKYVAYNATYADLCKAFTESQIIEAAYLLYFADEDWHEGKECTKIWDYMMLAHTY